MFLTVFVAMAGLFMGFAGGTSLEKHEAAQRQDQTQQCIVTDISTANSTCKLSK